MLALSTHTRSFNPRRRPVERTTLFSNENVPLQHEVSDNAENRLQVKVFKQKYKSMYLYMEPIFSLLFPRAETKLVVIATIKESVFVFVYVYVCV